MHQSYPPNFRYPEFPLASSAGDEPPEMPAPDIFLPKSALPPSEDYLPTQAQCAVHLELLECFHALKENVMGDEQVGRWLGLSSESRADAGAVEPGEQQHQMGLKERHEMKWQAFLELAVQRFEAWWQADGILGPDNRRSSKGATVELKKGDRLVVHEDVQVHELAADKLPPLGKGKHTPTLDIFFQ